ncbi:MAG: putative membrane-anchored protein [Parvicellaceae bacterium]|jgi:uncharacterized membrane-anchored protein
MMIRIILFLTLLTAPSLCFSQTDTYERMTKAQLDSSLKVRMDSIGESLDYELGEQIFGNREAKLTLSTNFKFLPKTEAKFALYSILDLAKKNGRFWGVAVPFQTNIFDQKGHFFQIHYIDSGYVHQQDLDVIEYEPLLLALQTETVLQRDSLRNENEKPRTLLNWALRPMQDTVAHTLMWGFEYVVDGMDDNLVHFEARILSKDGYISVSTEGPLSNIDQIKTDLEELVSSFSFIIGFKYSDYRACCDPVTEYGSIYLISPLAVPESDFLADNWKWLLAVGLALLIIYRRLSAKRMKNKQLEEELN